MIRQIVVIVLACCGFFFTDTVTAHGAQDASEHAAAVEESQAAEKILSLSRQIKLRSRDARSRMEMNEKEIRLRIARLKEQVKELEASRAAKSARLKDLYAQRETVTETWESTMADMKSVNSGFHAAVHTLSDRLASTPLPAFHPEMTGRLAQLGEPDAGAGIQEMTDYFDLAFQAMALSGTVEKKEIAFMAAQGRETRGPAIRAGAFYMGFHPSDGPPGFLVSNGGPPPVLVDPGQRGLKKMLAAWGEGRAQVLPMDITHGVAIQALKQQRTYRDWLEAGGILVWPILALGLVGGLVALGKLVQLALTRKLDPKRKDKVATLLETGENDQAHDLLSGIRSCPAAAVLIHALPYRKNGFEALDNALQEGVMVQASKLERLLSMLGIFAAIAPLLGLLGTVTGMIDTFHTITLFGTGDPRTMSTGISEALVTTQAGLMIAIPLLLVHHLLKRYVNRFIENMESACALCLSTITDGETP